MAETSLFPRVKGLEIVREVGRGGAAVVYEVRHPERGRVALKVLTDPDPRAPAEFRREYELLKRIHHEAVVPAHDLIATDDGKLATVLELVEGSTLEDLVARGEVPSNRAVAIVASAARALGHVHEAGIVHRDVKPANILVERSGRVRLLDFGIAKDLRAAVDHDDPDVIQGSPTYIAPEQAQALPTSPATDVWGLGVVLHELLTGVPPFERDSMSKLIRAIVLEAPAAPRSKNPAIGAATEAIVLRCLEKAPEDRFPNGKALADALETVLSGKTEQALAPIVLARFDPRVAVPAPPVDPKPRREEAKIHHSWSWDLQASPEMLWPLVSDTDRFNKAIGLPPVEWRVEPDGQGDVRRYGKFKRLGMEIEWLEYPFEWIQLQRHGVLRVYRKGPIEALWSQVTLRQRGEGSTLTHEIWIQPKNALGLIAAFIEMNFGTKRKIDEVYRALDEKAIALSRARAAGPALEKKPPRLARDGEALLQRGLEKLKKSGKSWVNLVPRLESEIRDAPDPEAARIRPYALAKRWNVRRSQALQLCVAAAKEGLLETSWHLLCPICRVPTRMIPQLGALGAKNHCDACDVDYENDLARSVELVFRPNAQVRVVPSEGYCPGGPGHYRHLLAQQELDPGESRDLPVSLVPGAYRITARGIRSSWDFKVRERLARGEGPVPSGRAETIIEEATLRSGPAALGQGVLELTITNSSKRRRLVRLERAEWREDPLTALEACGNPEVQDLVKELTPREPVKVGHSAYLAATITSSNATPIDGDEARAAFARVFRDLVQESGGSQVPREPLLAAFVEEASALEAAFRLHGALSLGGVLAQAPLRVAVHAGPSVASSVGGALSYEGPSTDIAVALLEECQPGEVATTHLVLGDPKVQAIVGPRDSRVQMRRMGIEGNIGVVYLRA